MADSGVQTRRKLGLHLVHPSSEGPDEAANSKLRLMIIAIHGLDTHSERTFRAYNKEGDKTSRLVHWLRDKDMLPHYFGFARIYTYDWNAATIADASGQYFHHQAQGFLEAVSREQRKRCGCPIIFIGSCYGGLILAKALCIASTSEGPEREVLSAAQGSIFLGTPFRGSGAASAAMIRILIAETMGADASARLVKFLQNETGSLSEMRHQFCSVITQRWRSSCRVACFFETKPTKFLNVIKFLPEALSSLKTMVLVDSESASLDGWDQIGLDLAHPGLSKFRGPEDENYVRVAYAIQRIVDDMDAVTRSDQILAQGLADKPSDPALPSGHQEESTQTSPQNCGSNESVAEQSASKGKGKSTVRGSQRETVRPPRSTTSRTYGTMASQSRITLRPDPVYHEPVYHEPVYHEPTYREPTYREPAYREPVYQEPVYREPYRRVPRVPTPPYGDFTPSYSTPSESPALKHVKNTLLGLSLVAVGAVGDSWFRTASGGTPPVGGCEPPALLDEETRGATEQEYMDFFPIDDDAVQQTARASESPRSRRASTPTVTPQSYLYPEYDGMDSSPEAAQPYGQQLAAAAIPGDPWHEDIPVGSTYPRQVDEHDLHDGYVVERGSRFRPGEIFKILWFEPKLAEPPRGDAMIQWTQQGQNGTPVHQSIRWFLIVANDEGHCTCVPISTYNGQACAKRGVKPIEHGIIYQYGKRPQMLPGEPQLGVPPVRVRLYGGTEQLVQESRVRYSKLTTVEHNYPVCFIGTVDPEDYRNIVTPAVDAWWERRIQRRRR